MFIALVLAALAAPPLHPQNIVSQRASPVAVAAPLTSRAGGTLYVAASDATLRERSAADWRCDGTDDQVEIQAALDALAGSGGSVTLSSGTFQLSAAARLVGRVHLSGQGRGTTLRATSGFQSGLGVVDGSYSGTGTPLDLAAVSHLTIDGNRFGGANSAGVHVRISSKLGFRFGSPDGCLTLEDLLVARTSGHGVHIEGTHNRAARVRNVRVWDVNGDGFVAQSPDGMYADCDAGSSAGAGIRVLSANNHFTACKAWYSDQSGFEINGVRNTFTGCSAQDNALHGFAVRAGINTFTGCHADSNSYLGGGAAPDPHQGLYDGFYLAADHVTMSACFAYDKNEGGRGTNQRYGVFVQGNRGRLNLQVAAGNGSTHNNFTAGIGGSLTGNGTRIVATGQTVYVTP